MSFKEFFGNGGWIPWALMGFGAIVGIVVILL